MTVRLRVLFVCDNQRVCSRFQGCLEREGCQLLLATDSERAARNLLSTLSVDAILIHHDDLARGSTIASGLKLIRPAMPVLLLTASWPSSGALPPGVDALCYAASLTRRVAHDITRFVRRFLIEAAQRTADDLGHEGNTFVPRTPTYLN